LIAIVHHGVFRIYMHIATFELQTENHVRANRVRFPEYILKILTKDIYFIHVELMPLDFINMQQTQFF